MRSSFYFHLIFHFVLFSAVISIFVINLMYTSFNLKIVEQNNIACAIVAVAATTTNCTIVITAYFRLYFTLLWMLNACFFYFLLDRRHFIVLVQLKPRIPKDRTHSFNEMRQCVFSFSLNIFSKCYSIRRQESAKVESIHTLYYMHFSVSCSNF